MQTVALRIPIQAAGMDDFDKQLQGMDKEIGASAYMYARPHPNGA